MQPNQIQTLVLRYFHRDSYFLGQTTTSTAATAQTATTVEAYCSIIVADNTPVPSSTAGAADVYPNGYPNENTCVADENAVGWTQGQANPVGGGAPSNTGTGGSN